MSLAFRDVHEELLDVIAAEHGRRTEDIYLEWMGVAIQTQPDQPLGTARQADLGQYDPNKDPLADLLGAFRSGIPDLGRRHDEFLGLGHLNPHDSRY